MLAFVSVLVAVSRGKTACRGHLGTCGVFEHFPRPPWWLSLPSRTGMLAARTVSKPATVNHPQGATRQGASPTGMMSQTQTVGRFYRETASLIKRVKICGSLPMHKFSLRTHFVRKYHAHQNTLLHSRQHHPD
jgi:hypothetical protein